MHIIITGNGFYFGGKVADFRRFLSGLADKSSTVSQYLLRKLH